MILPVAFVALLLCAEAHGAPAQPVTKKIADCKDWACYASRRHCFRKESDDLFNFDNLEEVNDDCPGIIMIRPYSKSQWLVVIESWNTQANEVKVLQGTDELFVCKKAESTASSAFTATEKMDHYSNAALSCRFMIQGTQTPKEVLKKKNVLITLKSDVPSSADSTIKDINLIGQVVLKTTCEVNNAKYDSTTSTDEVVEQAKVSLETVSCTNPLLNLQYKTNNKYVDVIGKMQCDGTTQEPESDYKYIVTLADDSKDELKGEFFARCHAKTCSFCTRPTTPTGLTAPDFGEKDGCKTLTCPKFFKIGDKITDDKAKCVNTDGDKFVWKIGESTVSETTAVECFEPKECKVEDAACPGNCKVDNGMPSCKNGFELSVDIKTKNVENFKNFTIACDTMTGQLRYTEEGKGAEDLPKDAKFSCTEAKQSEEKVATGGSSGLPNPLQACIAVATVLSLLLVVLSVGLWYWRKRKNEAKAAAESKSKPEKEKGAKDKGEAKQDE